MQSQAGAEQEEQITVALVNPSTGESETIPFPRSATLRQVLDVSAAIFGLDESSNRISLFKDGRPLSSDAGQSLTEAGVANGDMIAVQAAASSFSAGAAQAATAAAAPASSAAGGGGLDFSSLLAGNPTSSSAVGGPGGSGGGLDFGSLLGMASASSSSGAGAAAPKAPVYYPGMNLQEATAYNQHPETFVRFCT
jgi:hypothetical protein